MTDGSNGDQRQRRIPEFSNLLEEAEWWDTHDIADYLDELKEINLTVSPDFHSVFRSPVYLRLEDWQALERLAEQRAMEPKELAAEWLTERIRQEVQALATTAS